MMHRLALLAAAISLALPSAIVRAQADARTDLAAVAGDSDAAATTPDTVPMPAPDGNSATRGRALESIQVTATRRAESRLDVPVATTVLTADELRASGAPTVMEALRGETGVFVQQTTPGNRS